MLKAWISAMRLRTLPLAASCIFTGSALAWREHDAPWIIFALALTTAWALQILSNLANDYGDYFSGADNDGRIGPARAVQSGVISPAAMKRGIILTAAIAFVAGILLLWVACFQSGRGMTGLVFLVIGLISIAAAIRYTAGKNPYGYRGLGDVAVFLFFGIAGVLGTSLMFTPSFMTAWLLPATGIGCFSVAVLHLNNMRDRENDARSGKITIAVRLGKPGAIRYHFILLGAGWLSLMVFALLKENYYLMLSWLPMMLVMALHLRFVLHNHVDAKLDGELKKIALSTFLAAVVLFVFR
ncbi:MAG: 1,4-dihydroxy-2-naphthoate octaprenyltransferase [Flavobacteriales bacterium]|nr:1,4-dihydroxy-2-naphthoate octaprenyltransferase [Flavobacteriales bacterium]